MPLHRTGLTSRRQLDHPEEKPPAQPLAYELALKFNPNHDPKNGQFAAAEGARQGGTVGVPSTDAFGRPMNRAEMRAKYRATQAAEVAAAFARPGYYLHPVQADPFLRGGPARRDPYFDRGPAPTVTPGRQNLGEELQRLLSEARGHPGSMNNGVPTKRSTFS